MQNDGTVKIGVDLDKDGFKSNLSEIRKTADKALATVGTGFKNTDSAISTTTSRLKELDKALKLDPKNVELLDQKQRLLAKSAEETAEKYERLKETLDSSTASNVLFEKWGNAIAPLQEQIAETTNELKDLENQAKRLESLGFSPDSSGMAEIQRKSEEAREKLDSLRTSVVETYDEMGRPISIDQWDDLQRELSEAKIAADDAQESFDNFSPTFSRFGSAADDVSDKAGKVAEATKGISLAAGGLLTGMLASVKGTEGFRSDLSKLETNAQLAGIGLGSTEEAMRKLNHVSDETDSSVEALSNLLQAGVTESNLQRAVENLAGAAISFPDTIKIESLADGLQETLATGEATGQFAEVLDRLGVSTEGFNAQLSQVPGEADKLNFALDTLQNQGLSGVYDAWVKNNEALIENKDANLEFQESLARMAESMQPLMTTITELATSFMDWFSNLDDGTQKALVTLLGLVAGISPVAGAVSSVSGAISGVQKVGKLFSDAAGNSVYQTFLKWSVIILAVVSAVTLLIAMINVLMDKSDAMSSAMSSIGNASSNMTGGAINPKNSTGHSRMAAMTASASEEGDGGAAGLTASPLASFDRASAIQALETAMPNAQSRVAVATSAMAPAAGYSAPPMAWNAYDGRNGEQAQQPVHQTITIKFAGDLAQLGRVLQPIIEKEEKRRGPGV